ncbi:MAG: serine/threonine protein kinase [Acidovorax sp.]
MSHVDALPPGSRLGEFEILALLGVGGFGMVYKAFDHSLHRAVAIKEYMPSALAGRDRGQTIRVRAPSDQAAYQAGLASFVGEARLLAQFDHPSLVKVFRFWQVNNTAYMVMPLYAGMTLKQARAYMQTPPSDAWLRKLLWSVLGALRVLHDGKTLHRDISPDNIFLQYSGPPVLLDLGASRHAINDQDRKHTAVLKVNYAPIEQYADGDHDLNQGPWSDLYSLAAVVYGCVCNDTPLPATLRSIRDRMVRFSRVAKTVRRQFGVEYSPSFVEAISQSLALRPEERPQSIDAFLQVMQMTTPPEGLEYFDFRADLGDAWVEPAEHAVDIGVALPDVPEAHAEAAAPPDQASAGLRTVEIGATDRSVTGSVVPAATRVGHAESADTVFIDAGDTVAFDDSRYEELPLNRFSDVDVKHDRRTRSHRRRKRGGQASNAWVGRRNAMVWLSLAAVAVLASAAALRWKPAPASRHNDDIITEFAERPALQASAPASVSADSPGTPGGNPALGAESMRAAEVPPALPAAPSAAPPSPAPAVVSSATAPRSNARATRRPAAEPIVETAVVREPPPVSPSPSPPPEPPPPRPATVSRLPSPKEVCADAGFLARPMCVHQECQKPAQANQPICVENRRKYEAEEERRRQTPN